MQTELGGPHLVERTGKGFKLKILNLFFYVFLAYFRNKTKKRLGRARGRATASKAKDAAWLKKHRITPLGWV